MPVDDDSQALERLRRGDPAGFRHIFDRHHAAVFAYLARRSSLDRAELKDLLQDVFVQAHRHLSRLEGPVNLRAWLLTVARNRLISLSRQAQTESGAMQ